VAVAALLVAGLLAVCVVLRLETGRGEIVVQTDDKGLELTVRKNGQIIRIRDPKSGQTWDVDTKRYQIADADQPDGLVIELPGRGTITLRRKGGGTVTVTTGPRGVPVAEAPARPKFPTAEELAQRPNAADALKHEDVSEAARAYAGGGDRRKAPPELVAVLGEVRFRCPRGAGRPAFSADGKLLAVPSEGAVLLFELAGGRQVRSVDGPWDAQDRVAFNPDGRTLAVGHTWANFRMLDVGTGKVLWKLEASKLVLADFAFSADGKQIGFTTFAEQIGENLFASSQIEVRAVDTGKKARSWAGPGKHSESFAFHTSPFRFASVSVGGEVRRAIGLWGPEGPRGDQFVHLGQGGMRVAFSPDGKLLAVARKEEKGDVPWVVLYHADDAFAKPCHQLPVSAADVLAFSPDGNKLIAGSRLGGDAVISRWQVGVKTVRADRPLVVATGKKLEEKTVPLRRGEEWAVSSDGKVLAASANKGPFVRLFDVASGKQRLTDTGHTSPLVALAFSPDGKLLASSDGRVVRLWGLATGKTVRALDLKAERARLLAFSPDSQVLLTVGKKGWVCLWNVADGRPLRSLETRPGHTVVAVAFSPDGKLLATAGEDNTVSLWDAADGRERRILGHPGALWTVAFAPDGKALVSASQDGTLKVWEVATGTEKGTWKGSIVPQRVAFLPDGRALAVMGQRTRDKMHLQLWDWERGKVLASHTVATPATGSSIHEFGPAGHLLAASGESGAVCLWQPGGEPGRGRSFKLSPSAPSRVAFSPEGRYLAAANLDGVICLLRLAERGKVPELLLR
jgi:WD40 repeat protein